MKIRFARRFTLLPLIFLAMISSVRAQTTFSNMGSIVINDNVPATPYPSTIAVSGLGPSVMNVTVTLTGLSHNFPEDVGVLLVGPTGVAVRLMTDVGGALAITGITLTFSDSALTPVPDEGPIVSGTFQPTQGIIINPLSNAHPANFPAPAPASPYSNVLSSFNGTNPNGTWSLYVDDDTAVDGGLIQGGWSITITAAIPEPSTWILFGSGLVGMVALTYVRRRKRAA